MLKKIFVLLLILLFTTSFSYASKLYLNTNHKPFIDVYQRCGVTDLIEVKPLTLTQLQIFEIDDNCYNNSATLYLTDNENTFKYSLDTLTKASPVIYLGEDTNKINTNTITDAYLYIDGWPYKTALGELWDDEQELPFVSCEFYNSDNPNIKFPCDVRFVEQKWQDGSDPKKIINQFIVDLDKPFHINELETEWMVKFNFSEKSSFVSNSQDLSITNINNAYLTEYDCDNRTFTFEKQHWNSFNFDFFARTYQYGDIHCPAKP